MAHVAEYLRWWIVVGAAFVAVAAFTFVDPQDRLSGGSCRVGILWHEVRATALQFPSVTDVRFAPPYLFQP